ncbi:phospholipase D-like domain-containing protein [Paraburkholderia sp. BL10I2N1]|uniref:phospholipase D-like domain-containing protein n=1 Tax=Paraburkholderia sp. BL10I2N1 TaxID=1938796 RepID=UPI0010612738|nr:phospholipase D-like domain-containing protein [Paraburkholderia sp. BL10I2N1]TDN58999.1 phospholipase D-like protein [Paraburkholderia sp. BL10I2N1]
MKTLHTTIHTSLCATYAKSQLQRRAGGTVCSATLRSRFRRRKTGAAVGTTPHGSNTVRVTVHSKYIVCDGSTVETGSYNFSQAAARVNSENVLVLSNHPEIAQAYLQNWSDVSASGEAYRAP